jgi:hypothetical protein
MNYIEIFIYSYGIYIVRLVSIIVEIRQIELRYFFEL